MTTYAQMTTYERTFMSKRFPTTFARLKAEHEAVDVQREAEIELKRREALKRWEPAKPVEKPPMREFIRLKDVKMAYLPYTTCGWQCIIGPGRLPSMVKERHAIMWVARRFTRKSLPEIGRWLGRDHSTVHHGIRKVDDNFEDYRELIGHIKRNLGVE